jgi:hypothetical protein
MKPLDKVTQQVVRDLNLLRMLGELAKHQATHCLADCSLETQAPLKIKVKARHVHCSTSANELHLNQQRRRNYQEAGVSVTHSFDYLSTLQLHDLNENKCIAMSVHSG